MHLFSGKGRGGNAFVSLGRSLPCTAWHRQAVQSSAAGEAYLVAQLTWRQLSCLVDFLPVLRVFFLFSGCSVAFCLRIRFACFFACLHLCLLACVVASSRACLFACLIVCCAFALLLLLARVLLSFLLSIVPCCSLPARLVYVCIDTSQP